VKLFQGIPRYRLDELTAMPTTAQDNFGDLKWDDGRVRLWLSRTGLADGEPFAHTVTAELWDARTGAWRLLYHYDAKRPSIVSCPGGC
jgi:hypothetical protein